MWETDARRLAEALTRDFPTDPPPPEEMWVLSQPPAVRVIDCVFAARRRYDLVVLPRMRQFAAEHPQVKSCQDLIDFLDALGSPNELGARVLGIEAAGLGKLIRHAALYLVEAQQRFTTGRTELDRLRGWANWARPGDQATVATRGFGLWNFQYLRLLLGGNTLRRSSAVVRYVALSLGQRLSDVQTLYALERAAEIAGRSLPRLEHAINRHAALPQGKRGRQKMVTLGKPARAKKPKAAKKAAKRRAVARR